MGDIRIGDDSFSGNLNVFDFWGLGGGEAEERMATTTMPEAGINIVHGANKLLGNL